MNELGHYSPEDVTVIIGGIQQITGFSMGTFVTISKDAPMYQIHETSDGVVSRTHKNSQVYTVALTLASTADSNQILTYIARLDELTQMGKFPLLIKDQLGGTMFFSLTSWIEDMPDTTFSEEISDRLWVIKCSQASFNLGGNEDGSSAGEDIMNGIASLAPGLSRIFRV